MMLNWISLIGCVVAISCGAVRAESPVVLQPTRIIAGSESRPTLWINMRLSRELTADAEITVTDARGNTLRQGAPQRYSEGAVERIDLPLRQLPWVSGEVSATVHLSVREGEQEWHDDVICPLPDEAWTLHFIPGFHYDPVWWNTQANYTEAGERLARHVGPGITLVDEYMRLCSEDADYTVALHQLPYLKSFVEAAPHRVAELLAGIKSGRISLVGGTYNELSTTLISAEATIRNAAYGTEFQRDVLGGDGGVFWQCDVFGHDPSFPAIMAGTGHDGGGFARGPFHQWGAPRDQVNFPSEFVWLSPGGDRVLTHYMTGHYGYAYAMFSPGTNRAPEDASRCDEIVAGMFEDLRRPALTHHVLLPMHSDFIRPLENLGNVVRGWNDRVVSPKAVMSTPERYFEAVRAEIARRHIVPPVITRDMNPIYTGCPVSFADLKLAERQCETALRDAEILATLAALEGVDYPHAAMDRAWRQVLFAAHHDGVTGSMSDQVYLDMLYCYRDALTLAKSVRLGAAAYLTDRTDTTGLSGTAVEWQTTANAEGGDGGAVVATRIGCVAALSNGNTTMVDDQTLENDRLRVVLDPQRGGAMVSIYDRVAGCEYLSGPGNDLVLHEEYENLPGHGEGPWHLSPTGRKWPGTDAVATMARGDDGQSLVVTASYSLFQKRQTITLRPGAAQVDCRTEIIDWSGNERLIRMELPLALPGARPIYQTAAAVIGRPFARDVDTKDDSWTLDQTCQQWAGLGWVSAIEVSDDSGSVVDRCAITMAEIVIPEDASVEMREAANELAESLVQAGVTSTITASDHRRWGDLQYDSNTHDCRIELVAGDDDRVTLVRRGDEIPYLRVTAAGLKRVAASLEQVGRIVVRSADAEIDRQAVPPMRGVAVVNRGPVSMHITDGMIGLNLLRSCTSWPAGVWIDGPSRRLPDGAVFETMHGTHVFEYSIVPLDSADRGNLINAAAQRINHLPIRIEADAHEGLIAPGATLIEVSPESVLVTAIKPAGYAMATWQRPQSRVSRIAVRLWNGGRETTETTIKLERPIVAAFETDLLERGERRIDVRDGAVCITIPPQALRTVVLEVTPREPYDGVRGGVDKLDATMGDSSPSEYWLENRAEGNTGNGMLSITPDARRVTVKPGATCDVTVRVRYGSPTGNDEAALPLKLRLKSSPLTAARFVINDELSATCDLEVSQSQHREVTLRLDRSSQAKAAWSLVTIVGESEALEYGVTAAVWVRTDDSVIEMPFEIEPLGPLVLAGTPARARIVNHTDGDITGEASWLAPVAMWSHLGHWQQRITVPAGGEMIFAGGMNGGVGSYLLPRFTCGGRVAYGDSVAVVTNSARPLISFGQDRARFIEGQTRPVSVFIRSIGGVGESSDVRPVVPLGWTMVERARVLRKVDTASELEVTFDVTAGNAVPEGRIGVVLTPTVSASIPVVVAPVQIARPNRGDVAFDGDLSEWDESEFTEASNEFGRMRAAVRWDAHGLALAFDVEDEVFCQDRTGAGVWEGDSVQFGISRAPSTSVGYGGGDAEFGVALTVEGPQVWSWIASDGGETGDVRGAKAAIVRDGTHSRYEIFLPRDAVPTFPIQPSVALGFSYIANDNDGAGFRGAVAWTPGLSGKKDPSLFGNLQLKPE